MKCPVQKCPAEIYEPMLMCKQHWFAVRPELRKTIWRLFKSSPGSTQHREACFQAIEEVNAKTAGTPEQGTLL